MFKDTANDMFVVVIFDDDEKKHQIDILVLNMVNNYCCAPDSDFYCFKLPRTCYLVYNLDFSAHPRLTTYFSLQQACTHSSGRCFISFMQCKGSLVARLIEQKNMP